MTQNKETPDFSVIIPTYKRPDLLAKCLEQLAPGVQKGMRLVGTNDRRNSSGGPDSGSAPIYEVIVTDDSPDSSFNAELTERFPKFKWLEGPRRGPAANRNNGANQATGKWLVFTDDDCLPSSGWLAAYATHAANHAILEGRTIADRPRRRLDEESPINETGGKLWSCNFAIQKKLFQFIGGFDESFPYAAMEDIDFRLRLEKAEQTARFVSSAVVVHPWRKKKGLTYLKKRRESWIYLQEKHPELTTKRPQLKALHIAYQDFKLIVTFIFNFKFNGVFHATCETFSLLFHSLKRPR